MISQQTLTTVRTFCRPALESGLLSKAEFGELLGRAKCTPATSSPGMLTIRQTAELLAVSTKTVGRMIASDVLPAVRLTGSRKSLRIRASAVEQLMAEGS